MKKFLRYSLTLWIGIQSLGAYAAGVSAFGDLLVWHASEETTSIWSSVITTSPPNTTDFDAKNINFNWDPGFRVGIAYEPVNPFWDTKLSWTHFTTQSRINSPPANQLIIPEFFSGFLSENVFFGSNIDWKLAMNMIDLEASHQFNVTPSFILRPAIGIKGGTIDQTVDTLWNAVLYTSTEKVRNNFSGIGPSFGIDANWNFYHELNLVGRFSTAFMWGNWNVRDTYARPSALFGFITPTTITTKMNHSELGTLMFNYFLGLEWIHQGKSTVTLKLGYEAQSWANQLRLLTFQQLPLHGDLTLQGATCGISIDF